MSRVFPTRLLPNRTANAKPPASRTLLSSSHSVFLSTNILDACIIQISIITNIQISFPVQQFTLYNQQHLNGTKITGDIWKTVYVLGAPFSMWGMMLPSQS